MLTLDGLLHLVVGVEDVGPHQLQGPGPLAEVVADGVRYPGPLELLLLLHQGPVYVAGGVWHGKLVYS